MTAKREYAEWTFINRNGTAYDLPEGQYPKCCYGTNTRGEWYWFKNSGEDYWFRKEKMVPKYIRMAALLLR